MIEYAEIIHKPKNKRFRPIVFFYYKPTDICSRTHVIIRISFFCCLIMIIGIIMTGIVIIGVLVFIISITFG